MKMKKKLFLLFLPLVILFSVSVYAFENIIKYKNGHIFKYDDHRFRTVKWDMTINVWYWKGKKVTNNTQKDFFIPNKTQQEWDAFV